MSSIKTMVTRQNPKIRFNICRENLATKTLKKIKRKIQNDFHHTSSSASLRPSPPSQRRTPFAVRSSASLPEIDKSSPPTVEEGLLSSELYAPVPFPPIKAAKRVVLVRHGQSTWNEEGMIQGSSNFSVLTKKGEAQAETSRQMLIDDSFDVCFCSLLADFRAS